MLLEYYTETGADAGWDLEIVKIQSLRIAFPPAKSSNKCVAVSRQKTPSGGNLKNCFQLSI